MARLRDTIDVGVDDHVETTAIGDGRSRCEACGYLWPCPTLRALPRPLDVTEREVLDVVDVGVGFSVWRRQPEGAEADPQGGTVVGRFEDEDGRDVYRVVDFAGGRPRFRLIRADEIEPATVGLPNGAAARSYARRLAERVAKTKGAASHEEVELLSDALALLRSIT